MKKFVLSLTALAMACGAATAADRGAASLPYAEGMHIAPPPPPSGAITIFDNINRKVPTHEYNCCNGFAISGPNNTLATHLLFDAMGFTPLQNLKVIEIDVAAAYHSGVNEFSLALYNDKNGVPGTALKVWSFTNLQPYGSCCALAIGTDPGVPVVAGQQYWVVMRTDHNSLDTTMFWDTNVLNTTTHYPFSQYCSNDVAGPPCSTPNDQWSSMTLAPALAFAVFGKV